MHKKFSFLILLFTSSCWAANEIRDVAELRSRFGLDAFTRQDSHLKIAILDNGFMGFDPRKNLLPASAERVNDTSEYPPLPTSHGLAMAQIIWAMTGQNSEGPHFYLINTNGFTNLKNAVQFVIDQGIQIVLYSQVWAYGGNMDGTGFINAQVQRALDKGVIWINAAGNFHGRTFNEKIGRARIQDQFLNLKGQGSIRFENKYDDNLVEITLRWSDFKDDPYYNTHKDLDLYVTDEGGKLVGSSVLVQRGEAPTTTDSRLSSHAREVVKLPNLERGQYRIWVRDSSRNFSESDYLRITIEDQRDGIDFVDRSEGGEILPPADHPGVITVGDLRSSQSSVGPTADGRDKPDVLIMDSKVSFTNNDTHVGSSNAAAIFAGIVATMRMELPHFTYDFLARYLADMRKSFRDRFDAVYMDLVDAAGPLHPSMAGIMPEGSYLMRHRMDGHWVILTQQDPLTLPIASAIRARTLSAQSRLFYLPPTREIWIAPQGSLCPPGSVEFRQMSPNFEYEKVWQTPALRTR